MAQRVELSPRGTGRALVCLAGAITLLGLTLAACGPSTLSGLATPTTAGGGGSNPTQTSANPLGTSGTTTPGGNGGTTSGGTLDSALVGDWVEESDEMTGDCEDIYGFTFDGTGDFSFSEDPENDNCATVVTYGQWSTNSGTSSSTASRRIVARRVTSFSAPWIGHTRSPVRR
jgi:hypothetical protein